MLLLGRVLRHRWPPARGSIYDLAAPLLGYDLRGPEFPQLKSILVKMFQLQAT